MTSYETYTQRYQTISQMRRNSKSASKYANSRLNLTNNNQTSLPISNQNQTMINEQPQIGRIVSKLQDRVQGIQVKIVSLTNIVKLLQKYSQTKDDQYQKEKQNSFFKQNLGQKALQIQALQMDTKIKEFNILNKQLKEQIQSVQSLKLNFQANLQQVLQNSQKKLANSNKMYNSQFYSNKAEIEQLQGRLRQQLNKKIQICMKQIKKITSKPADVNAIDETFFQQQINAINFSINKIQNECLRNKMIVQNQIQQIFSQLRGEPFRKKASRQKSVKRQKSLSKNLKSDRSFSREKSNRSKMNDLLLAEKKKIKQEQLREAIRKKKENKEKLKGKL